MKLVMFLLAICLLGTTLSFPQVQRDSEEEDKIPYSFSYDAARHFGGVPDREHKESRGPDGITRGVFRFVDPNLNVQEVVYHSDDSGFHAVASNIPKDTAVVEEAKTRHQSLYERITEEHAKIGEQLRLAAIENDSGEDSQELLIKSSKPVKVIHPPQSRAVAAATQKHQRLFQALKERNADSSSKAALPRESQAVLAAREKHHKIFETTIKDHAKISEELKKAEEEAAIRRALEEKLREDDSDEEIFLPAQPYEEPNVKFPSLSNYLPKDSRIVAARKKTHQRIFNRILDQHSRLADLQQSDEQ